MKNLLKVIFVLLVVITNTTVAGKYFVYISLRSSNAVKIFELNKANGNLSLVDSLSVPGGPAAMTLHPSNKYLFVAQREAKNISTYAINDKTGKLSYISTIKAIENPVYLSCDKSGKYLLSAYYAAGRIASYKIEKDGRINSLPVRTDSCFKTPHCILIDNTNKFVFVADKDGDKISQYLFDSSTGKLIPNNPFDLVTPKGTCPRHLVFSKNGKFVFFVNEVGNTVTSYNLENSGQLTSLQTIPTLPDSFKTPSKTADIHLTPDNKFLYVTNRGHNSIAGYSANMKTGMLGLIGTFPTEKNPRSFAIDPSGKYLIVAGESSDCISTYMINEASGLLKFLCSRPVGKQPSWVMIIEQ